MFEHLWPDESVGDLEAVSFAAQTVKRADSSDKVVTKGCPQHV